MTEIYLLYLCCGNFHIFISNGVTGDNEAKQDRTGVLKTNI